MSLKRAPEGSGRSLRPPRSLAARLTLWYTGSAFALILVVTGFLYWALSRNLLREDDDFIADQISILRTILREHPEDLAALRQEVEWESSARRHAKVFIRILDAGGRRLAETPGMPDFLAPGIFPPPVGVASEPGGGITVRSPQGPGFRLQAAQSPFGPSRGPARILQVALDRREEEKLLANFAGLIFPSLGVSLLCCAAAGYQIARRGIRPVAEISKTARRIRSSTLGERIEDAGLPAELSMLAGTFNDMLGRLQDSFERLSRFSADIAHELRTPLSNLRGEIEVAIGKTRPAEEYREILCSLLEECLRLSRLIDSLLFLARAENPQTTIRREPCDVRLELETIRDFYEVAAAEAGVALQVQAGGPLPAALDRALLQRAVGNLIENALAHTPPGGRIALSASLEGERLRLQVEDSGCGIAPEHLPSIFDRFYRVDRSRSAATGGAGLGLSIVKSIAELHGGTATIASEPGRGTRVELVLDSA